MGGWAGHLPCRHLRVAGACPLWLRNLQGQAHHLGPSVCVCGCHFGKICKSCGGAGGGLGGTGARLQKWVVRKDWQNIEVRTKIPVLVGATLARFAYLALVLVVGRVALERDFKSGWYARIGGKLRRAPKSQCL